MWTVQRPPHVRGDPAEALLEQDQDMEHQDELQVATVPTPSNPCLSQTGPRCVNGRLVHPEPSRDDACSKACSSSSVTASGGVCLDELSHLALYNHLQVLLIRSLLCSYCHLHHFHRRVAEGVPLSLQRPTRASEKPCPSASPEIHQMDPTTAALGQENMIQTPCTSTMQTSAIRLIARGLERCGFPWKICVSSPVLDFSRSCSRPCRSWPNPDKMSQNCAFRDHKFEMQRMRY